ncbi:HD domain-containing phosphohydrolase [Arthrobacter sp. ERGS1:01]|uniref:HD domain-containing phosphohydrolase n=1 Tax=Arthrobacter sp. ERGS1:01 TaxID=1704044 RepID=UPI000AAB5EC7|nr:HD domain-containing phosphohydrolase [Arthrobacter sp. ERGS1:01]
MLGLMLRHNGSGLPPVRRAGSRVLVAATASNSVRTLIRSHCTSAGRLAERVGLGPGMAEILGNTFERWDGKGLPAGRAGAEIPPEMRIAQLADTVEVFLRDGGVEAAVAMVGSRRGTQFDPELADIFCAGADSLTRGLFDADPWPAVMAATPDNAVFSDAELDSTLQAIGDFADLKSPCTVGHSRAVAALAVDAACGLGLGPAEISALRRAGWVHDLGRMGVSNGVWDKVAPLSYMDRERIHLYPYLSERILSRVPGLGRVAELAVANRERLDGSGYPRGVGGRDLDQCQRLLAAGDEYQSYLEPRPHRPPMPPPEAAARLLQDAVSGRLDAGAVDAVLAGTGRDVRPRNSLPGGLTARELEVLRLWCRGTSHRDIGAALFISPKTVRNHIEHIYLKLGVGNRVGATLFSLDHDLWSQGNG